MYPGTPPFSPESLFPPNMQTASGEAADLAFFKYSLGLPSEGGVRAASFDPLLCARVAELESCE